MTKREIWNKTWDVNVSGTSILTEALVPLLLKSKDPRILFLTSGTASCTETEDPGSMHFVNKPIPAGWPKSNAPMNPIAYRSAKTGLNMMARQWERTLREDGVKIFIISPGFLATNLALSPEKLREMGAGDPSLGGIFIKDVVEGKRDSDVGKAIRSNMIQPW
jgi:NAD(P)-dependent dehydrogenase (short-subunit alcohol dehydrogenase family)